MPSVPPGSADWNFHDNAPQALEMVDATALDAELDNHWSSFNALLTALAVTIRDDNQLEDEIVRIRCLHPETVAYIQAGGTVVTPGSGNQLAVWDNDGKLSYIANGVGRPVNDGAGNWTWDAGVYVPAPSYPFALPTVDGANGQAIVSDGSGGTYWVTLGVTTLLAQQLAFGSIANEITSSAALTWDDTGKLLSLGVASTSTPTIRLYNATNAFQVNLTVGTTAATYTLTLPTSLAGAGTVLADSGSGVLAWITPLSGTGTAGTLPKWATSATLVDSLVSESGSTVTVAGNLSPTGYFQFNTSITPPTDAAGRLYWDATEGTLSLGTPYAGTVLSIGQEMHAVLVNKTGAQVNDGQVIYIAGAQGNRPSMGLGLSDNNGIGACILGLATNNIADNAEGVIAPYGVVRGINTSSFAAGDVLYASPTTPGGITNVKPLPPNRAVRIGWALNSTVNGSIFVSVDLGTPRYDLHVKNGFENRTDATLSYDNTTRQLTVTPASGTFRVWNGGAKHEYAAKVSPVHANTTGVHYFYLDTAGVLQTSMTAWDINSDNVLVASVFYDASDQTWAWNDERHGATRNRPWHEWAHLTLGTRYASGLGGTFGASTFSIAEGYVFDEDIHFHVTGPRTQGRVWRQNGASMRFTVETTPGLISAGTLQYDAAGALMGVPVNDYVINDVYATTDPTEPIYIRLGTTTYNTLTAAQAGIAGQPAVWVGYTPAELKLLYRVMLRNQGGTPTYISASDYRNGGSVPGGGFTSVPPHAGTHGYGGSDPLLSYDTITGYGTLTTAVPAAGLAGLVLPHGDAPTGGALVDGAVWTTALGLYARINGATVGPLSAGGGAPALTATYVGFGSVANELTGSSNLTFDNAKQRLIVNQTISSGTTDYAFQVNSTWTSTGAYRAAHINVTDSGGANNGSQVLRVECSSQPLFYITSRGQSFFANRATNALTPDPLILIQGNTNTNITATNEAVGMKVDLAAWAQWASGTVATQRFTLFTRPLPAGGTCTVTKAATVAIENAPLGISGCTVTNPYALWIQSGKLQIDTAAQAGKSGAALGILELVGAANTTMTASVENTEVYFNLAQTKQFATGALTTQRAFRIDAPTYSFVGASTITTAATLAISGAPGAGTNATITTPLALWVQAGKTRVSTYLELSQTNLLTSINHTGTPGSGAYLTISTWDSSASAYALTFFPGDVECQKTFKGTGGGTAQAPLRLTHQSAAPDSPVDGDMWSTSSGFYVRINGSTYKLTVESP